MFSNCHYFEIKEDCSFPLQRTIVVYVDTEIKWEQNAVISILQDGYIIQYLI